MMRVGEIALSRVDGPGLRWRVRVQGCPHRCPGCFVPETHPFEGGEAWEPEALADRLASWGWRDGLTVTGGEPFAQEDLADFLRAARARGCPHIILYSGYTFEELLSRPAWVEALRLADVLVDGPFILEEADERLAYRGSRNQRVLDLVSTFRSGHPVLLDWDRPAIIITGEEAFIPLALLDLARRVGLMDEGAVVSLAGCAGGS